MGSHTIIVTVTDQGATDQTSLPLYVLDDNFSFSPLQDFEINHGDYFEYSFGDRLTMDEGYSSADKDFKEWSLIDFPDWLNFNGNNGAVITGDSSSTTIGSHEVKLSVTNAWGASTSENFYITVNGKYAPELSDLGIQSLFNGSNFSLQINATDADLGDTLTFEAINLPTWLEMSSSGLLSGIPGEEDIGTHSVTVQVTDFSGLTDQKTYEIDVQSIFGGSAPVINDYEIPNATEDLFYSFQIGASDADPGDQITFSGINLPEWLVISDSGLLSGDPDKSDVGRTILLFKFRICPVLQMKKASIFRLKM